MNQFCNKITFLVLFSFLTFGEINAQFVINGDAFSINDTCYQLTSKVNDQVGTIWNETKVDLTSSFVVSVEMYFGDTDFESADGIVFGLQRQSTSAGIQGGDIGFGGITPSIGIEFDTWQNIDFGDPEEDHIAISKNGNLRHNTSNALAGPIQASATNPDIEDDAFHNVRILWDADSMKLSVFFDSDCEPRLTYFGDIVNEIFGGDPEVFWGFTSATGGRNSIHQVCLSFTTFLDGLRDTTISCGESVQLEAGGGVSYKWTPAVGLSDPNIANPIATPSISTEYTVEIIDDCGLSVFDDLWVNVENNQFDVEIEIVPDTLTGVYPGSTFPLTANVDPFSTSYTYVWSSVLGSVFSNPNSINTSVTFPFDQTSMEQISVLVTDENDCQSEASLVIDILDEEIEYLIPNIFSPNGDSRNESFGLILEDGVSVSNYNCKIFNRWGQIVFESNIASEFWDGTQKNEDTPVGVYIYVMSFELGGVSFNEAGDVTLLR